MMSDSASKSSKNGATGRQKKSSFQITSVTATRPMSNDAGDDSADDLDESHTDDISRVTEGENETPSFSEDTFSKDDVFFNTGSTSLCSAPVIPTSSQYGLAIVPTHDAPAPGPDALDVINIGNVKTEASEPHVTTRNERFKVVKIESTEPFKRGRWQCMDYLDHSGYDEDSHEQSIPISTPKPVQAPVTHNPNAVPTATQSHLNTVVPNQVSNMMPANVVSNAAQIPNMASSSHAAPASSCNQACNIANAPPPHHNVINPSIVNNIPSQSIPNMPSQNIANLVAPSQAQPQHCMPAMVPNMAAAPQHIIPAAQNQVGGMSAPQGLVQTNPSIVPQPQPIPSSQQQQQQQQLPVAPQGQPQQSQPQQQIPSQAQLPMATQPQLQQTIGTQGQMQQPMATQPQLQQSMTAPPVQPQQMAMASQGQLQQPIVNQSQQQLPLGAPQSQPQQLPMVSQGQPMQPQGQMQPMNVQAQMQQPIPTQSQPQSLPMAAQGQMQQPIGTQGQMQQPIGTQGQMQQPIGTQGQMQQPIGAQGQMQQPIGTQNQMQQSIGTQSQPQSLSAMPQALQQAGQQQMQQQLMQQQLQQQMQYYPQPMHQGAGMMGMMQQYPVQMPPGYGQPSYVPTMPQILPQQMMQPNFQNFQQHPQQATPSPSFPNSVQGGGMGGYSQSSQPVMSYTSQPQHPGMSYPQVMLPKMVPQVPHAPTESDLQVGVALLESLVEANIANATANANANAGAGTGEQPPAADDAETLFPSRLAQALAAYKERLSAATSATRPPQPAPSRAPSPSPSASGTSAVAIDNKIEQAMDLVKSHLMFAVREEVEVLREKIAELMDRINLLELENSVLKSQATPDTLATLAAQVTAKTPAPGAGGGPPPN